MKLSIIVCVYNEIETIEKILSKIDEVNLEKTFWDKLEAKHKLV